MGTSVELITRKGAAVGIKIYQPSFYNPSSPNYPLTMGELTIIEGNSSHLKSPNGKCVIVGVGALANDSNYMKGNRGNVDLIANLLRVNFPMAENLYGDNMKTLEYPASDLREHRTGQDLPFTTARVNNLELFSHIRIPVGANEKESDVLLRVAEVIRKALRNTPGRPVSDDLKEIIEVEYTKYAKKEDIGAKRTPPTILG